MKRAIRIEDDVRDVLNRSSVDGNILRLPPGQLDRKLYERTNKALEALGGAWNRSKKGHVFDGCPRAAIAAALDSGKVVHPNEHDFFRTSDALADVVAERLAVEHYHRILEPQAGDGSLVNAMVRRIGLTPKPIMLRLIEIDPRRVESLRAQGYGEHVICTDFLKVEPIGLLFDRIAMNPPFHMGADTLHVGHALDFIAPGGRLVAIVSGAFNGRTTKTSAAVLDRLGAWGATFEDLPAGSFKGAGTNVATKLLVVDRPMAS